MQFKWSINKWLFLIQFGLEKSWICRFLFFIFFHVIIIWYSLRNFILFIFLILYLDLLFIFFLFIINNFNFFWILFVEILYYYVTFQCYISDWTSLIHLIMIIIILLLPAYSINISKLRKIIESRISILYNWSFACIFFCLSFWRKCLWIASHYQQLLFLSF